MKPDWRTNILKAFTPDVARVTVASDTDGLLGEEKLYRQLSEKGFSIIQYGDPIAFRFTYETEFRQKWDAGEGKELIIVLGPGQEDFNNLPADVLDGARRLSFFLQDVFPNLSYNVVSQLDKGYFDPLFSAHRQYAEQPLGDALTKDFILRHVFEIAPELIKRDSDLLRTLLQMHYRRLDIPDMLDDYLVSVLQTSKEFSRWPIETLVDNREAFWDFLQERWPLFVATHNQDNKAPGRTIVETVGSLSFPYPVGLPFDHDDVRIYIDTLFAEGILKPVNWVATAVKKVPWIKVGMTGGPENRAGELFGELCKTVEETRPEETASARDWLMFAQKYARLKAARTNDPHNLPEEGRKHCDSLCAELNATFASWVARGYVSQYNYPPTSPVMVHHIPGFLAHLMESDRQSKTAFLLLDGLSYAQWYALKDTIETKAEDLSFHERALLAWIPSITPVSRQAAFSGRIPSYFADTIQRTDKDGDLWRHFWADRGLVPDEIAFTAVHGNEEDLNNVDAVINHKTRVLGLTVYKVDKIMHGAELGEVGMASQVRTWGAEPFLAGLLNDLVKRGFEVWLSADHGNTEAVGVGTLKEGVLSESKGERCRVYSCPTLRDKFAGEFPDAVKWDHPALPDGYSCLLAPAGQAFTQKGHRVVCHGGCSIDEVVVPFIRITGKGERY